MAVTAASLGRYTGSVFRQVARSCGWQYAGPFARFSLGDALAPIGNQTRAEAQQDILDYIVMFYNSRRLHSTLDYTSPNEYESAII